MKSTIEILAILNKILTEKEPIRIKLIKSFQNEVWGDKSIIDETLNEILTELAYDLDFYEPNKEWRKEDTSYYGGERLEYLIKDGITKIENYNKATQ